MDPTAEALVQQGDTAWKCRSDRAALDEAISAWERAVALDPHDAVTLTKLARAHYFVSDAWPATLDFMERGVSYAERALSAASPRFAEHRDARMIEARTTEVEAAFWFATSLTKWSRKKGLLAVIGNLPRANAVMRRLAELDTDEAFGPSGIVYGAVDRFFGGYLSGAPRFAGRDLEKARRHFEKSIRRAPYFAGTRRLYAVDWAVKRRDRALFERLLNEVLALPDGDAHDLGPETRLEKRKAAELLAEADALF